MLADHARAVGSSRASRALRRHGLAVLALLALTVFLFGALLAPTGFVTHEGAALYLRTEQYLHEIGAGHFPPLLFPRELGGAGYAFPLFYPPLGYWLAAALAALTGDVVVGTNLSLLLAVLLAGLACYGAAVWCGASRWLALGAAALYIAAPYRLVDVYVRGALAESAAFAWYPLILGAALVSARRGRLSLLLPIAIAGLLLTHAVMALYFALLALPFAGFALVRHGRRAWLPLLAGTGGGAALALWHLLPAQQLASTVRVGDPGAMRAAAWQVGNHAIEWGRLWRADPARWFGYSPYDMSFHLGLTVAVALGGLLYFAALQRARGPIAEPAWLGVLALISFEIALFFATNPRPLLAVLPAAFGYIQFPWRVLGLALFFATFGAVLAGASPRVPRRAHVLFAVLALAAALLTPGWERAPRARADWTGAALEEMRATGYTGVALTVVGEYLPAGVATGTLLAALDDSPRLLAGRADLVLTRRDDGLRIRGRVRADATVRVPLLAYPLYRATAAAGGAVALGEADGLLTLQLPPGPADVTLRRHAPAAARSGMAISALALLLLLTVPRMRRAPAEAGGRPPAR